MGSTEIRQDGTNRSSLERCRRNTLIIWVSAQTHFSVFHEPTECSFYQWIKCNFMASSPLARSAGSDPAEWLAPEISAQLEFSDPSPRGHRKHLHALPAAKQDWFLGQRQLSPSPACGSWVSSRSSRALRIIPGLPETLASMSSELWGGAGEEPTQITVRSEGWQLGLGPASDELKLLGCQMA